MSIMTPEQVLARYWTPNKFPVDPVQIARLAGIMIEPLPEEAPDSGYYHPATDTELAKIQYSTKESLMRQRFIVSHELGHYFLGHCAAAHGDNAETFSNGYDSREVAANRFAAELLMPANAVERAICMSNVTLTKLALTFGVSEAAIRYRLINLGWLAGS